MENLRPLIEQTTESTAELVVTRESARGKAIAAIRQLEFALVGALDGEKLRGLPVLLLGFHGANVRKHHLAEPILVPGLMDKPRCTLVLNVEGKLVLVTATMIGGVIEHPVEDAELLIEDVECFARVAEKVLEKHITTVRASTVRFRALERLSEVLTQALAA